MEAVLGLVILALMVSGFVMASGQYASRLADLRDLRQASATARAAIDHLQSGQSPDASLFNVNEHRAVTLTIEPGPAIDRAGLQWIHVTASVRRQQITLHTLISSDQLDQEGTDAN